MLTVDLEMIAVTEAAYTVQTCSEYGLYHLAPLVPPVSNDSDDVSLPHLQTGYSKTALASTKLLFNSLATKHNKLILQTQYNIQ